MKSKILIKYSEPISQSQFIKWNAQKLFLRV